MTIDEAIEQFKNDAEYNRANFEMDYAEENEQFANWLEELKTYKGGTHDKQIRADERVNVISELLSVKNPCDDCYSGFCESCNHNGEYALEIYRKLHQLKEKKK